MPLLGKEEENPSTGHAPLDKEGLIQARDMPLLIKKRTNLSSGYAPLDKEGRFSEQASLAGKTGRFLVEY
jgi:hypothetical protein